MTGGGRGRWGRAAQAVLSPENRGFVLSIPTEWDYEERVVVLERMYKAMSDTWGGYIYLNADRPNEIIGQCPVQADPARALWLALQRPL